MDDSEDYQNNANFNSGRSAHHGFLDPFSNGFGDPFGDFMGGFGSFGQHFQRQMKAFDAAFSKMDEFMQQDPSTLPRDGGQYYCSSVSTTVLPNGVVETKRQTRTNDREQKEHYRQLGDRRVVSKVDKDLVSGREDRRRDLYNVQEDQLDAFDRDFSEKHKSFEEQWGGRYLTQKPSKPTSNMKALTGKTQKPKKYE